MADYLEGDLELDQRALFDAHLDDCLVCAEEIAGMRGTIALLHNLPDPQVPAAMSQQVMRRIRSGETRSAWRETLNSIFAPVLEPRILAPISAGLLVLGLVIGTGEFSFQSGRPEAQGSLARGNVLTQSATAQFRNIPTDRGQARFIMVPSDVSFSQGEPIQLTPRQSMIALSKFMASPSPLGQMRFNAWPQPPLGQGSSYGGSAPFSPYETVAVRSGGNSPSQMNFGSQNSSFGLDRARQPSADEWLVRLQDDPSGFAGRLAAASLAEQELWVEYLAKRALKEEQLDDVVASLRSSPSRSARLLADDFEATRPTPPAR